jgi:hypothetical protein
MIPEQKSMLDVKIDRVGVRTSIGGIDPQPTPGQLW